MFRQVSTVALMALVMLGSPSVGCNKPPEPTKPDPKAQETGVGSETHGLPKELTVDIGKGVKLEMVLIPSGEFLMGSPDSDKDARDEERPQHRVRITKPFYLGKYKMTQQQWAAVMGNNPSYFKGQENPVEEVSWDDCQQFLKKLNERFRHPLPAGEGQFQLPSEA